MGRPKTKVVIKDWRIVLIIGYLAGIVTGTAPQLIVMLLLVGGILLSLKLVDKGRI